MRTSFYVVEVSNGRYVRKDLDNGLSETSGLDGATRLSLSAAHRACVRFGGERRRGNPRRFPRIIKVTVETKTIFW